MTTFHSFLLLALSLAVSLFGLFEWSEALPAQLVANSQDRGGAQRRAQESQAELQRQKDENREFLERFRKLGPEERVKVWKESNDAGYQKTVAHRISDKIQNLLIIEGTDTVSYLASIIRDRRERYFYRFWAVSILANMDRYVPKESLPKGAKSTLGVDELNLSGAINPFVEISGQRIGSEGRQALLWAANESEDKSLQFFARNDLGLVKQELSALPLEGKVRRWRDSVAKAGRTVGKPENFVQDILTALVVESAPDCLPALIEILNHDENGHVRTSAVGLIRAIDAYRFRLRKTELGRSAIEAVRESVIHGRVRLDCPKCETAADTWRELSAQFLNDDFGLYPSTHAAYYAQMLHSLYGEDTIRMVAANDVIKQEWAIPQFGAFITFLTDKDPFFPSWEYVYLRPTYSQAFHPKFQAKIARIEDAWKQFNASGVAPSEKP